MVSLVASGRSRARWRELAQARADAAATMVATVDAMFVESAWQVVADEVALDREAATKGLANTVAVEDATVACRVKAEVVTLARHDLEAAHASLRAGQAMRSRSDPRSGSYAQGSPRRRSGRLFAASFPLSPLLELAICACLLDCRILLGLRLGER
jgi:hypothetical protein